MSTGPNHELKTVKAPAPESPNFLAPLSTARFGWSSSQVGVPIQGGRLRHQAGGHEGLNVRQRAMTAVSAPQAIVCESLYWALMLDYPVPRLDGHASTGTAGDMLLTQDEVAQDVADKSAARCSVHRRRQRSIGGTSRQVSDTDLARLASCSTNLEADKSEPQHHETCRLEPIENPFSPKVLPMSPE